MKHLIICGTGAFARELYWHAQESIGYGTEWDLKGFIDGPVPMADSEYAKLRLPVLGVYSEYEPDADDVFTCAIGSPAKRKDMINTVVRRGGKFINVIHKTAIVQGSAKLGNGVLLCPFTYVNDNATVGDYVMINTMSGLGHDVELGEYSCLMGHVELCGFVKVGKEVYFGGGSRVLPEGKVGDGAFVGSGSIVLKKVKAGAKVFGNPALEI